MQGIVVLKIKNIQEILQGNGTQAEYRDPSVLTFRPMEITVDMYEREGLALRSFFEKAMQKAQQIGDWAFADECAAMLGITEKDKPSEFQRPT